MRWHGIHLSKSREFYSNRFFPDIKFIIFDIDSMVIVEVC